MTETNLKRETDPRLRVPDPGISAERSPLAGWVDTRRDHGGLIFIDLRDRAGITQVVFNPEINSQAHQQAHQLRSEYVISIQGMVRSRPEGMTNPNLKTGEIEVLVQEYQLLNTSKTPPFNLDETGEVSEAVRLRYRYLDLRRPLLQKNFFIRHQVISLIRYFPGPKGILRYRNPFPDQKHPRRGPGLSGPQPDPAGKVLCPAPVPAAFQTTPDGGRF